MLSKLQKDLRDDISGATAIEYGLIVSLIVIAMIVSLGSVADATNGMWDKVSSKTETALASTNGN